MELTTADIYWQLKALEAIKAAWNEAVVPACKTARDELRIAIALAPSSELDADVLSFNASVDALNVTAEKVREHMALLLRNPLFRPTFVPLPAPPSNIIPNVALTLPTAGQTFSAPGTVPLSATATDPDGTIDRVEFYRESTLIATVTDPSPTNYALAANGGVATASSTLGTYSPSLAINGDRRGVGWGTGTGAGGWNDSTSGAWPDSLEVDFGVSRPIGEMDVFTLQDNYASPIVPTLSTTFALYGVTAFQAQYWNGSIWVDVPGGNVTGNNLVWRQFIFTPVNTTKIRVLVNASLNNYSRIVELEAWASGAGTSYNAVDSNVVAGIYNYTAKAYDNFTPEGVNTSLPVSVTVEQVIIPPVGQTSSRVLVHEGGSEGPSWLKANQRLRYSWIVPGGDYRDASDTLWGSNHYAAVGIGNAAKHRMTIPSSAGMIALVNRLRLDNTGFYLYGTMDFNVSAKENTAGDAPPTLTVIANSTYALAPTHDSWMDDSGAQCLGGQGEDGDLGLQVNRNRVILKFDLSQIVGPVTSATLALTFDGVGTLFVNYLDMPALVTDPAVQIGGALAGLRGTVAEADLAAHASVEFYGVMDPVITPPQWRNYGTLVGAQHESYKTWPEFGVQAQRLVGQDFGVPVITVASWRADFTPREEYWLCYTLMIDADVRDGYNLGNTGHKLPGLIWSQTDEGPGSYGYPHLRLLHGKKSDAHPHVYRLGPEFYTTDNPNSSGAATEEPPASVSLVAGKIYSIEEHVKLNTPGVRDGIVEMFVDGVRGYNDQAAYLRGNDSTIKLDQIFFNIFLGGGAAPLAPMHYEVGPVVLATQYIGPLKKVYPAWRQGMPVGQFSDIPNTNLSLIPNSGFALTDWNSVAHDYVNDRLFCAAQGGHGDVGTADRFNGVYGLNLKDANPGWYVLRPTSIDADILPNVTHYKDNRPSARHSYYYDHFVPSRNRIFLLAAPVLFGAGINSSLIVDSFNLATNDWDLQGTWNAGGTAFSPAPIYQQMVFHHDEVCCAQDRRTGDIWIAGLEKFGSISRWVKWTAATATFQVMIQNSIPIYWHGGGTVIDVIRNKWLHVNQREENQTKSLHTIDLANPTVIGPTHLVTGLDSEPWWSRNHTITHDTKRDKYLIMANAGRVYEVDPVTFAGTVVSGVDTWPWSSPFNKFAYCPELDGCFFAPGAYNNNGVMEHQNVKFLPLS